MKNIAAYRKTVTALMGAVILTIPLLSGGVTSAEWVSILIAFATAFGVYGTSNEPVKGESGQAGWPTLVIVLLLVLILLVVTGHLHL